MPRVTYETPDGTAKHDCDDVVFHEQYIVALTETPGKSDPTKKRVPMNRVVEVDG